jgi:hypothetical protein
VQFAPMLIAIAVAVLGAHIALRTSTATRLSNLDLSRGGFADSYLVFEPSDPDRAFLLRRGAATLRRSDPELQGVSWSWARFGPSRETARWILRDPAGPVLLLPLDAIEDWSYPFLFAFVAHQRPELGLPRVSWTQLHVHRVYSGLYLQIDWRSDTASADDELVRLDAAGPVSVSTALDDGVLYRQISDAGVVPQTEPPDELLAWLASLQATAETVLLLPDAPPFALRWMPLPFSLSAAYELRWGRPLEGRPELTPPRLRSPWEGPRSIPLGADEIDRLRERFAVYAASLRAAVTAHRRVFGPADPSSPRAPGRAAEALGWGLQGTAP